MVAAVVSYNNKIDQFEMTNEQSLPKNHFKKLIKAHSNLFDMTVATVTYQKQKDKKTLLKSCK